MSQITDDTRRNRFELEEAGQVVFADYSRANGMLMIRHVEAPLALRGKGAAGRLMEGLLALARDRGEKVVPVCSYAAAYMRRHAQHADLLA